MAMHKPIALIPALLAWCLLSAQLPNSSFLHYTTDQGLSSDHITALAKDNLGFLWVGTVNGLNRFDGRTFRVFRHIQNDRQSIPHDHIMGITVSPDGLLWVATMGGLCRLDPFWLTVEQISLPENADSLDNDAVTRVEFDSKGMAWTTAKTGIYKIRADKPRVEYFIRTAYQTLGWYGLTIDEQDRLWMLKDTLRRFDPVTNQFKNFVGVDPKESLVRAGVLSLVQEATGEIWAGTWGNGIWKYNEAIDEFEPYYRSGLSMMVLPDTSVDGRKFFWVGGGQAGLAVYYPDSGQWMEFTHDPEDPFSHNNYLAVLFFKDQASGDIWIGTEIGLEHFAPATIRFGRAIIPREEDMNQFSLVSGVVHDHTDKRGQRYYISVWGTGLFSWNKSTGKFTRLKAARSRITGTGNFNLFQDRRGYIWGTAHSGIGRYHPQTNEWSDYSKMFQYPERNNLFWCGLEDQDGQLWFGSNKEGLFRYNFQTDKVEPAFYKKEFADENGYLNIMDISLDTTGHLWLACNVSGLIRFDPASGEAVQFTYPGDNTSLICNAVEVGQNGHIYAGFYGDFLELDAAGHKLRHFNQQNGLKTNHLFFMVEDQQGIIWMNSAHLLHRFDPVTGTFTYYGKPDGLFSNIMTDALSITPSGEIFVGFQNAFNYFFPDQLRRNLFPPPVAITSIKVMNKERAVSTGPKRNNGFYLFSSKRKSTAQDTFLTLRPNEDFFEIEFAALNFNQQERNLYAYRLEGFNKDWIYTERPVATFTNLDGGRYTLHMKAANNDGIWNEKGVALQIVVNPPFHRTMWFYILVLLAMAGILFGILWIRRQHRLRLEKFRESLARDLHDEMGSTLSSIRFFSEYASQQIGNDKPQVTPLLQRISQSATNLSESMQDIIWAMKTTNDQLEDLITHMTEFGLRMLEARNVTFKTQVHQDFSGLVLQPEVRRNMYLIFKEAINNAAKYAEATEVVFQFTIKNRVLSMIVSDNGKGFDPAGIPDKSIGNGLSNMRKRAAEIGGSLDIFSKPGDGTRVVLKLHV